MGNGDGNRRSAGQTFNDGLSRPFQPQSRSARMVAAIVLAKRDGWAEIRPAHWAQAGAVVKALKAVGALIGHTSAAVAGSTASAGQPASEVPPSAEMHALVERVNGFVYAGDRLNAVVDTVAALRADPTLAQALLGTDTATTVSEEGSW